MPKNADTIRTAAARMRFYATNAIQTPGRDRFFVSQTHTSRTPIVVDDANKPTILIETWAKGYEAVNDHVASWDPATALLVADLLDSLADGYDEDHATFDDEPSCPNCGEGCGGHDVETYCVDCDERIDECACPDTQALRIARAFLGEDA